MIRITKVTDHGIVLLTHFALVPEGVVLNARDLAGEQGMTMPMVAKILKMLAGAGLLASHRGAKGGYSLARAPDAITVTEIVTALEGPIAITECNDEDGGSCDRESFCHVRPHWLTINQAICRTLDRVTLRDLAVGQCEVCAAATPGRTEPTGPEGDT